jgi:transmembrane sensor
MPPRRSVRRPIVSRNVEDSPRLEQVEEAAAAWLLRRESPEWSQADDVELAAWLSAAATHRVSYMRLRSVWRQTGRLKVASGAFTPETVPARGAIAQSSFFSRKRRRAGLAADQAPILGAPAASRDAARSPRLRYGLAAGVALVGLLVSGTYLSPRSDTSFRTPVGGMASVPMGDGSRITLNSDSEIELEVSDRERRVNLSRGEAFFDVAKDPSRPFVVYANRNRVVAVGTKFAVRLKPDAVQVVVTEGEVRVEKAPLLGAGEPVASLVAGNIANSSRDGVRVDEKPVADAEQALSWRTGHVVLRKTRLGDAVAEFNRYNVRQIVIADPALAQIEVGGNFQSGNIDGFVRLLQAGFRIHAEDRGARIVLSRRAGTQ